MKGDMQLVGPRPEVPKYVDLFHPQFELLLEDRPGITDPATLAYRREDKLFTASNLIEEEYIAEILPDKLRISLAYQKRRSFLTDLVILARTIFPFGNPLSKPKHSNKSQSDPVESNSATER
jgi:lipopolysaccharide/colanic/teichoic acid biosynthesis glycosyltransferase